MNTVKIDRKNTKMIAHRGLSGIERENTCAAFVAAGNRSYFGIETDVHVTRDGRYIIIHDDSTARVGFEEDVSVEGSDFDTLRKVALSERNGLPTRLDLRLPSLEEYISICKKYEKKAILELKNPMTAEHIKGIYDTVAGMEYEQHTVFISFCLDNLIKLKEINYEQSAQYLLGDIGNVDETVRILKKYALGLDAYHKALSEENVKIMHDNGIEVNAWTVDTQATADRLISWGVDYITTDILE